ncbi:hypothetical protein [Sphingomonas montanisoli]|uniref:Uncharacterized protein n=1 Tax=Sphingomonas montanisoli TaxID=2606412 RepID=A0A5D9C666_9SPHN|nr:hypothetical protein [Sphingomonas montanisoli]TZG27179.1 hypothetical protein FYJ91_06015 [Sphingomonas montanisoli]
MEDGHVVTGEIAKTDADRIANAGGRPGGAAKGGSAPRPGDPANPERAADDQAPDNAKMRANGFGDHKGQDLGRDGKG